MSATTLKILYIDEKRITTDLDKAGYRKMGAQIIQATSYKKAQEHLDKSDVDVIVINYDYKEVDPSAICEHFQRSKGSVNRPLVFTSVQNLPTKVLEKEYGPDLFIQQPIRREYFIERLRKLLEQSIRDTDRVEHVGVAEFTHDDQQQRVDIQDISSSGLLLASDLDIKAGTKIELSFELPGYKKPVKVEGEVVRKISAKENSEVPGIGVRFVNFQGDSQKRLEKFIAKSQIDDPKLVYYL